MTIYITPTPAIPTLPPTIIYEDSQYPLKDQINEIYTQIADVVNLKGSNQIHQPNELTTNDIWVDGRVIFTKTFATGTLLQGMANPIAHGITGLLNLVKHEIVVISAGSGNQRMLPYASPTAANAAAVDVTSSDVVITTGASFGTDYSGYVTIFYTTT